MAKQKLTIKQKKINAQKAALLQRITDVYSGAQGSAWDMECDFATAQILENAVNALNGLFSDSVDYEYMWEAHCLSHYDTPQSAMEFLFEVGIRA